MPFVSVTIALTVPLPAGLTAVIDVDELTVTLVAEVSPNLTVAGETKPVPAIVTDVPPAAEPVFGLSEVTVGAVASACALPSDRKARTPNGTASARTSRSVRPSPTTKLPITARPLCR